MTTFILCCLLAWADSGEVMLDRPVPKLWAERQFESALERTITASWKNVELRDILRRISAEQKIAILLDRRIDPTQKLAMDINHQPVLAAVEQIAYRISASVSVAGNTIYVGPAHATQVLRTLIEMRSKELFTPDAEISAGRRFELVRPGTVHWNDLDEPVKIASQIADQFQLDIQGIEKMPHDLWAGATLPNVNCSEALSLVLIQWNLTFQWADQGQAVRIIPIPEDVAIEKFYNIRRMDPEVAIRQWREKFPQLQAQVRDSRILVRGTVEQHEAIDEMLHPDRRRRKAKSPSQPPLHRQRFTLRIERVPVRAIMKKLEMSGIVFQYDAQVLQAAGVDLDQFIRMDVEQATAEEFFEAMFGPLDVDFQIDNLTVTLTPKSESSPK